MEKTIPKVIHYCWFGRNPLPQLAKKCIDSWKKYCPDYRIIEWNEDNFDINSCTFIQEAYAEKKWAFVSDAARLLIIYKYGGVYLDTDVELIASLDDIIEDNTFFYGIEKQTNLRKQTEENSVNTGLGFGAIPKELTVKALLGEYWGKHFIKDGVQDMTPCPIKNSRALRKFGFSGEDKEHRFLGGTIYPSDFFCPTEHLTGVTHFSERTISVHHYGESWVTPRVKYWMKLFYHLKQYLPDVVSHYLASYLSYVVYDGLIEGHFEMLHIFCAKAKMKLLER